MKKFFVVLLAVMLLVGCGNTAVEPAKEEVAEPVNNDYIVDVNWLNDNLDNVYVFDARVQESYDKGHIPGAVSTMWQGFSAMSGAPGEDAWGTVLPAEELSVALANLGVTTDKEIIVYCNAVSGWGEDGRLVWMLRNAGLDQVKILDGGYDKWVASGFDVSKEAVTPVASDFAIEAYNLDTTISTEELANRLDEVTIIDVREADEFEGAAKFGEARGGHIPNSIQLTFNEFLNEDGTLKSQEAIQSILDEKGIKKEDEIVTYCTAGIRSAHMQVILEMLGYEQAKNYDSSFYAWAGNESLPLE